MATDEDWMSVEDTTAGFSMRCPSEWRPLRNVGGCAVALLAPASDSEFRSSLTVALQPSTGRDLAELVRTSTSEMDRYFTDYEALSIEPSSVDDHDAIRVRGTYRHGRVTVAMDQWVVDARDRLLSFTASYDRSRAEDFAELSTRSIATVKLVSPNDG